MWEYHGCHEDERGMQEARVHDLLHNDDIGNVRLEAVEMDCPMLTCCVYDDDAENNGEIVEVDPAKTYCTPVRALYDPAHDEPQYNAAAAAGPCSDDESTDNTSAHAIMRGTQTRRRRLQKVVLPHEIVEVILPPRMSKRKKRKRVVFSP